MYSYRVFCCADSGEDSVSGVLDTMIELKPGHIHVIKGRSWICEWVDVNHRGEPIANFLLNDERFIRAHLARKADYLKSLRG